MQRGRGSQRLIKRRIRSQVSRVFWLRRRSVRYQGRPTWNRNEDSDCRFEGTRNNGCVPRPPTSAICPLPALAGAAVGAVPF